MRPSPPQTCSNISASGIACRVECFREANDSLEKEGNRQAEEQTDMEYRLHMFIRFISCT